MKKIVLLMLFALISNGLFAQDKEAAENLVNEGVAMHDKGDYDGAIAKYDKALLMDKDNLMALTEKAFSLFSMQKYEESVLYCQKAIEKHPGEKGLKTLYVTYGNALDGLNRSENAIEMYDEGIKQFPDYYQLYFNKAIALANEKKYDEAILCFQKSVMHNPTHASSHNAIARFLSIYNKNIPSLLAYCRFLILEPQTKRAKENLEGVKKIMKGNVVENGNNNITLNINPAIFGDTTAGGKPKENNFSSTELILSMSAALDHDKKNKDKTAVEQFIRKFDIVCSSLKETKQNNYGFYWNYYVPYFTAMKDKNLIEPFAYIVFASDDNPDVSNWIKSHQPEIDKFYEWSDKFSWETN